MRRGGLNAKKIALIVFGVITVFMLFFVIYKFLIIKEGADETPAEKTARYKTLIQTYRQKVTKLDDECKALGGFKEPKPPTQQVAQIQSYYNKGFIPKDFSKLDDKALTSMIDNLKLAEPLLQDYKKTLSSAVDVCKAQAKTEFEKAKADAEAKQNSDVLTKKMDELVMKNDWHKNYLNNELRDIPDMSKFKQFYKNFTELYSKNINIIKTKDYIKTKEDYDAIIPICDNMINNFQEIYERTLRIGTDINMKILPHPDFIKDPQYKIIKLDPNIAPKLTK